MKTGSETERHTAKNCFYPILLRNVKIVGFGDVPNENFHPKSACIKQSDGTLEV
jgi:adenine-specific DNA-methyltransferase